MPLPIPIPYNWNVGDTGNAALLDAAIRDPITFLLNPPIAKYAQTSAQTLTTSVTTSITWPTPALDYYGGYAAGTPTRYTPTVAGWYLVVGNIAFAPNVTGPRDAQIAFNGASVINHVSSAPTPSASFNSVVGITSLVQCNGTTDYFELQGEQVSGANLATVPALTTMTILWVHA